MVMNPALQARTPVQNHPHLLRPPHIIPSEAYDRLGTKRRRRVRDLGKK